MTTLREALSVASALWSPRPGGKVMCSRARVCIEALEGLGVSELGQCDVQSGTRLLGVLQSQGNLSTKSLGDYYRTFTLMLRLNGLSTVGWPSPPSVPRKKAREAIPEADLKALVQWLRKHSYDATADLGVLMHKCGLRVAVEGMGDYDLFTFTKGTEYDTLRIIGKGGHERVLPVVDPDARRILGDNRRMAMIRSFSYRQHLTRWTKGVEALRITTRKPTPHAARHAFATEALANSGGNLVLVQELMGHASPVTTAGYLGVDLDAKARALGAK